MSKFYVGTKMVDAWPEPRLDEYRGGEREGYGVRYPDGYVSWSPKDTFEAAYRENGRLDFGGALMLLKHGERLRRRGWNGEGMFVFLVQGSTFAVNRAPLDEFFGHGTEVTYRPHLDMKAADGTVGVWVPSQTDILACDWETVS